MSEHHTRSRGPVAFFSLEGWQMPVVLLVLSLAVYANSFPGAFILDDKIIVVKNPLVQQLDLLTTLCTDYWHNISNSGLFRPLTILSLAVNRVLFGTAALGFHLVNVLLHALVAVLFWRVLLAWQQTPLVAGLGAVMFAVHPLHTEVVNVVVGRSELLVAVCLLTALLLARSQSRWSSAGACGCFLLALLSKEHAITFLAILPILDASIARSPQIWRQRWPLYTGLLVIAVCWLFWRKLGVQASLPQFRPHMGIAPLAYVDIPTRILSALAQQWLYLGKLLVPVKLQAVYASDDLPALITSPVSPRALLLLAATVGTGCWLLRPSQRQRPWVLLALLYLLAFLPTANLVFATGVSFAERLTYFPSLWFCAALALLLSSLVVNRRWAWVVVFCYVAYLAGTTVWRNRDFSTETRLWSAEVANNPRDYVGWLYLAESLRDSGDNRGADQAYATMHALAPDFVQGLRSRVNFLLFQGAYAQALPFANRVFQLAQETGDSSGMALYGRDLAEAYVGVGECQQALVYLDGPVRMLQEDPQTIRVRMSALSCLGRDADAIAEVMRREQLPLTNDLRHHLGISLLRLGRLEEARVQLETVVGDETTDVNAWNLLGVICVRMRDWPAAITAFERAVALSPQDASLHENLRRARQESTTGE